VTFLGWADKARIDRCLADADVFILPSYSEGLPLAILEALAIGVPVVCTPVGEIPHVLEHRRHALLVQPGNRSDIAAALSELARSESLRELLANAGRQLYESCFSMERFARHVTRIHREQFGLQKAH
jgi:glycosyltransferase involved in cell wall biosynthesis